MIRTSVKGVIKFMESDDAQRRRVLAAFKYAEAGRAPRSYYREAIPAIRQCLAGAITRPQMRARADALRHEASTSSGGRHTRLMHNARGILSFDENFGGRGFRAATSHRLSYVQGGVRIAVHPELWVFDGDEEFILKLELAVAPLDGCALQILAQLIYQATVQNALDITPDHIGIMEVAAGKIHRGRRIGPRLESRIAAALENIEALWPSIKRPAMNSRLHAAHSSSATVIDDLT